MTLQRTWLDDEESEWNFENVLPTVQYTICNSTTVQVEHAPLEMFTLHSVATKVRKSCTDKFDPWFPGPHFLPVMNEKLFYCHFFGQTLCDWHTLSCKQPTVGEMNNARNWSAWTHVQNVANNCLYSLAWTYSHTLSTSAKREHASIWAECTVHKVQAKDDVPFLLQQLSMLPLLLKHLVPAAVNIRYGMDMIS